MAWRRSGVRIPIAPHPRYGPPVSERAGRTAVCTPEAYVRPPGVELARSRRRVRAEAREPTPGALPAASATAAGGPDPGSGDDAERRRTDRALRRSAVPVRLRADPGQVARAPRDDGCGDDLRCLVIVVLPDVGFHVREQVGGRLHEKLP